jgi:hypothetical protein
MVFGVISQKRSMMSVTTPVAITIPYSSGSERDFASERLAIVPRADAATFTRLFPIITVMRRVSISDFILSRDFAHHRRSLTRDLIVCLEVLRNAISVPEKNAERQIRMINITICEGSKGESIRDKIFLPSIGKNGEKAKDRFSIK